MNTDNSMNELRITIGHRAVERAFMVFLLLASLFLFASLTHATTPNPGHPWTDIGNGNWQVNNTQTGTRTFTFPDADTTVSGSLGPIKAGTIPYGNDTAVIATTSAGTPGFVLALLNGVPTWAATTTLATISGTLGLANGGTNASLTAVNGGIIYSNASALAVSAAGVASQVLQSGGAGTPTWSTATYPATAGNNHGALTSDGTNWGNTSPSFNHIQVLTSGTTYTPSTGVKTISIVLVGGGGGGGGALGGSSLMGAGSGGGSGGTLIKTFGSVTGTYAYTIGGVGTAGAATGGNGGAGGNTTFTNGGTTYTAFGGSAGTGQTAANTLTVLAGGAGGVVSTNGDVNSGGESGSFSYRASGIFGWSGNGGSNAYGGGGLGTTTAANGTAGLGYGAGGAGGMSLTTTGKLGGVGTTGALIVFEHL